MAMAQAGSDLRSSVTGLARISCSLEAFLGFRDVVEPLALDVVLPLLLAARAVSLHRVACRAVLGLAVHLHGAFGGRFLLHQQGLRLLHRRGFALELVLDRGGDLVRAGCKLDRFLLVGDGLLALDHLQQRRLDLDVLGFGVAWFDGGLGGSADGFRTDLLD